MFRWLSLLNSEGKENSDVFQNRLSDFSGNASQAHVTQPLTPILDPSHCCLKHITDLTNDDFLPLDWEDPQELRTHQSYPTLQATIGGGSQLSRAVLDFHLLHLKSYVFQCILHPDIGREGPRACLSGLFDGDTLLHEGMNECGLNLGHITVSSHLKDVRSTGLQTAVDCTDGGQPSCFIAENPVESRVGDPSSILDKKKMHHQSMLTLCHSFHPQ